MLRIIVFILFTLTCVSGDDKISGSAFCVALNNGTCVQWSYDISMSKDSSCFSGDSFVHMKDGTTKIMSHLNIGDEVMVHDLKTHETSFSQVYTFLHVESSKINRTMKRICSGKRCLVVSSDHLLFDSFWIPIFAGDVVVGTKLLRMSNQTQPVPSRVESVQNINSDTGIYAPATYKGTIIVNTFVASIYAATRAHDTAHHALAPLRTYYRVKEILGLNSPYSIHPFVLHPYVNLFQRVFKPFLEKPKLASTGATIVTVSANNHDKKIATMMHLIGVTL